jgi:hypothetical protein
MKIKKLSLLQNFNSENLFNDPFPHVIIDNALPNDIYDELINTVPNDLIIDKEADNKRGNIYQEQLKNNTKYKLWSEFLSYNNSKNFLEEFTNIFNEKINLIYPGLLQDIKKSQIDNRDKNEKNDLSLLSCYSYNTPVLTPSAVRGVHLDYFNKLYVGLYYMRPENDLTKGGDLIIYKWKNNYDLSAKKKILYTEKFKYLERHTEEFKKIEYKKNTLFLGLNTIDSLHGITVREKTKEIRQFCYFTSHLNYELVQVRPRLFEKLSYNNISIFGKLKIIIYEIKLLIEKIYKK